MRDNWERSFANVIGSEGGFSDDSRDRGNWTSGVVGQGQLKGTKWGISAMSYPRLDIKNLTQADAKRIYKKDYWDTILGDELPAGLDYVTFDAAVNSGQDRAVKWLQRALLTQADGVVGPETLKAAEKVTIPLAIDRACDDRLNYLKSLPTWDTYGKGWTTRVSKVRTIAKRMHQDAAVRPQPAPESELDKAFQALVKAFNAYVSLRERQ